MTLDQEEADFTAPEVVNGQINGGDDAVDGGVYDDITSPIAEPEANFTPDGLAVATAVDTALEDE